MSEFLAEARILVRPDTTKFRAELEAALATATAKPITIPIVPVVAGGLSSATAQTNAFTAAQIEGAAATNGLAAALEREAVVAKEAAAAQAAHSRSLAGVTKGAVAQGASLLGLRAGTLAASSAFIAGTVAVLAFAKAVQSAAQLETELNVFRVTAGATADEMARVADEAKQLGRDLTLPGVTANDAAVALTELSKAGLSVQDSLDGARGVLQLATAAQIDNINATKLVAGALNSFALSGNEAVRVADLLTGAAKESQGEISDMGTALAQASAVAHLAGVSIEDTVVFLTELSKAGISGGRAGTSLRVAFLRLINPTDAAAKALKDLNIQVRDSQGNIRPQVFTDLQTALEGLGKAQAQATLATIFGTDAVRAAAIIGAQGAANFDKLKASVTELGLAQEQAAARTQGFQGDVENLKNQLAGLGLTLGTVAKGPVGLFVKTLATVVSDMNLAAEAAAGLGQDVKGLGTDLAGVVPFADQFASAMARVAHVATILNPAAFGLGVIHTGLQKIAGDADVAATSAEDLGNQIEAIVAAGKKTGGDVGLNQTLVALDALSAKLREGGPEAQKFATAITELRRKIFEAQGLKLFPDNVRSLFPPELLTGQVFKEVGEKNVTALQKVLNPSAFIGTAFDAIEGIGIGIDAAVPGVVAKARTAGEKIVAAATLALGKLDEAFDVATAAGSQTGQLASLRAQAAAQQQIRNAEDARAKAIGAGNAGFATAVKKRREAQKALASLNEQIRGIEAQIVSDQKQSAAATKSAADAITKAARDREQALLSSFGLAREQRQNKIAQAAQTEALQDDISQEKKLKALVLTQIAAVKERISVEGGRAAAITALRAILTQIDGQLKTLAQQQQAAAAARRQNLIQSATLDIDLAQITGNQDAEVSARKKLIVQLKAQQALVKRGTNEWKQLRNDIAAQNAAIAEVTAEKKKQKNAFGQATFEFLQAQQGFASNLLGNLIPSGSTAGLVGGGSVQNALTPVAGAADGRSQSGPTSGQANASLPVQRAMLQQLRILNGDNAAPEAGRQNRSQRAVMDGVGGG